MFSSFESIEQYRNVIDIIQHMTRYIGRNPVDNKPMYDHLKILPTLKFNGTVKLHGTNSAIGYDPKSNQYWAQSRGGIVTATKDNVGFAKFAEKTEVKSYMIPILSAISSENENYPIVVYGEWCGAGIQKGVAIANLPKMFVIFAVKVLKHVATDENETEANDILLADEVISRFSNKDLNVWNVNQFKTWEIEIDFNQPKISQNELVLITDTVEKECPVGASFGVKGVGEGVVWTTTYLGKTLRFKVKGDEHSSSKVTTLAPVDTEKLENINKFIEYSVTENRLNQGIEQVFTTKDLKPNVKQIADFLKWVVVDVLKEESDTIKSNNIKEADVVKEINSVARKWFLNNHK